MNALEAIWSIAWRAAAGSALCLTLSFAACYAIGVASRSGKPVTPGSDPMQAVMIAWSLMIGPASFVSGGAAGIAAWIFKQFFR